MKNYDHNRTVLATLEPGDMIKFRRGIYSHWGIYYGAGMVIHFTEREGGKRSGAVVRMEDFWTACDGKKAYKSNAKDRIYTPGSASEILGRAESVLNGTSDYNFITNNCEHFASWCRYGIEYSEQSRNFVFSVAHVATSATGGAVAGGIVGGPVGAVLGAVCGAVGATIGGVVNGVIAHVRSQ